MNCVLSACILCTCGLYTLYTVYECCYMNVSLADWPYVLFFFFQVTINLIHDFHPKIDLVHHFQLNYCWRTFLLIEDSFVWIFFLLLVSATRMHTSSHPGNGCYLSSEVWYGKNCCLCSVYPTTDWTCCRPSSCPCPVPYKRTSISGSLGIIFMVLTCLADYTCMHCKSYLLII